MASESATTSLVSLRDAVTEEVSATKGPLAPLITAMTFYIIIGAFAFHEYLKTPGHKSANSSHGDRGNLNNSGRSNRRGILQREYSPLDGSNTRDNSPSPSTSNNSPSQKRSGEMNRKKFYHHLLIALIIRIVFLPLGYMFTDHTQITSIVSWSLPNLSSAMAYSVLVLFFAQVVATVSGTPNTYSNLEGKLVKGSYIAYATIVALNCVIPVISGRYTLFSLWAILCGVYLALFISMLILSLRLMDLLKSSMNPSLLWRLMTMSTICCLAFSVRSVIYGWEAFIGFVGTGSRLFPNLTFWNGFFGRTVIGLICLECLPALVILIMMYKKTEDESAAQQQSASMMAQLEAGLRAQISPTIEGYNPVQQQQEGANAMPGMKKSLSANGGEAAAFRRPSLNQQHQQQQQIPVQPQQPYGGRFQRMGMPNLGTGASNNTMSRSMSGGRQETVSLLGDRSKSAQAATGNSTYGATK